jgi:hypothetical protein
MTRCGDIGTGKSAMTLAQTEKRRDHKLDTRGDDDQVSMPRSQFPASPHCPGRRSALISGTKPPPTVVFEA